MVRVPQAAPSRAAVLPLVGSELAFDLTNTSSGRGGPRWLEHLQSAENVIDWARRAKVLTEKDHRQLRGRLAANRRLASQLLARTIALRDLIYGIGVAIASGGRPRGGRMDQLVGIHAGCLSRARLVPTGATFAWVWNPAEHPVEAILGPVALSAMSLLSGADLSRIKQCPGDHCGWLFFDTTKNKRRRWCEMEVCGNRAKQKRRRARVADG
jgi:predicted RNA-binding Zn ribbon-like protein